MKKSLVGAMTLAVLVVFSAANVSAQLMDRDSHPGTDVLSFNLYGGGFFSTSTLAAGTEFDDTGTVGGTVTYWVHHNVGVRGNVLWASPAVVTADENPLVGEDPNVWHYSGDLVLRLPLPATGRMSLSPYLLGGLGGKTYDFETLSTASDFAGNFGVGVEVRFGETGRLGLNTEVRDFISNFDRHGFDSTLNDVFWTGGITFNF